ncbi:unnamed protein product [Coccothraustes coccothraustes]
MGQPRVGAVGLWGSPGEAEAQGGLQGCGVGMVPGVTRGSRQSLWRVPADAVAVPSPHPELSLSFACGHRCPVAGAAAPIASVSAWPGTQQCHPRVIPGTRGGLGLSCLALQVT